MKCPKCRFENRADARFCEECGARLWWVCPRCAGEIPIGRRYCGECGQSLLHGAWMLDGTKPAILGERKQITVLFSDLTGYTAITERLDPEEVNDIMTRIFGEITRTVERYGGFVGRFLGDAAMVLFGIPESHEDDAVRAIRAAREIHNAVEAMSPDYQNRIGRRLTMHSGINSGLAIISDLNISKAAGEITGDTVNVASRLCSLAEPGAILVGQDTYLMAQAHFVFRRLEPLGVDGRSELVQPYRVVSLKEKPAKIWRFQGLQADLIGRDSEMSLLKAAAESLGKGQRAVVAIHGDPGTGKTRLVEEFRAALEPLRFRWLNANSYGYTQNIPYWPLIDLFNRLWEIEEDDSPKRVRQKLEAGVQTLLGQSGQASPVIGSLYSLDYPGFEDPSPELWKTRLFEVVRNLLATLAGSKPTVICLEDLHWADPPFLELLRFLLSDSTFPALFVCVYRTPFHLFSSESFNAEAGVFQKIHLQDLSPAQARGMLEALLKTKSIPSELTRFVDDKVEGNPFYLEEVLNSLIESETLVQEGEAWKLTRSLADFGISPTIQGVIAARLDRLNLEMKRVLQEASVIGRNFLYVIIKHITELKEYLEDCLGGLEQLDLIRTKSIQPELEYLFKHALTQEVVYKGLLKKERQAVHERIGLVMEDIFRDRLPEMFETLAFHFKQGYSVAKAADYLIKSGEKSLKRYALEESHQYFREAYELLTRNGAGDDSEKELLIDVLIKWSFVYYYSGEYRKLQELLTTHLALAETLTDKSRLGMYYAWLSCAMWHREMAPEAYDLLLKALRLGEDAGDRLLVGYACTWLTWTCIELGRLDEAVAYGEWAQECCRSGEMDHYVYFNSLAGLAYARSHRGERRRAFEDGKTLVEFGERNSNVRSVVMGHCFIAFSHMVGGDIPTACSCFEEAVRVSADPWYSQFPSFSLCYARISNGEYGGLQERLERVRSFCDERGAEYLLTPSKLLLGAVFAAQGELGKGMRLLEESASTWMRGGSRLRYCLALVIMGRIYAAMAQGAGKKSLGTVFRNLGFLVRNAPFADRKAVALLNEAIQISGDLGAKDTLGRASLVLGLLHKARGRHEPARECLLRAVHVFGESEADIYLKKAEEALRSLAP